MLGTLLNFEPRESASITSPWPAVLRDEAGVVAGRREPEQGPERTRERPALIKAPQCMNNKERLNNSSTFKGSRDMVLD